MLWSVVLTFARRGLTSGEVHDSEHALTSLPSGADGFVVTHCGTLPCAPPSLGAIRLQQTFTLRTFTLRRARLRYYYLSSSSHPFISTTTPPYLKHVERICSYEISQADIHRLRDIYTNLFSSWHWGLHKLSSERVELFLNEMKVAFNSTPRDRADTVSALHDVCGMWKAIHHQRYQIICRDAGRFTAKTKKDGTKADRDVNWPSEVQRQFNTATEQWRTSGLANIDVAADKFQTNLTLTSRDVMKYLGYYKIHLKTRAMAETDWKHARERVNNAIQLFRTRAKETSTRSH
jgi:hypothetical protein